MLILLMYIACIFHCTENRAMDPSDVYKPVEVGCQSLLHRSIKVPGLIAEVYSKNPGRGKEDATMLKEVNCEDVIDYNTQQSHNTITLPATSSTKYKPTDSITKLIQHASALDVDGHGYSVALVSRLVTLDGKHCWQSNFQISLSNDLVSRFLHGCLYADLFNDNKTYPKNPMSLNGFKGCFYDNLFKDGLRLSSLARLYRPCTDSFNLVVKRDPKTSVCHTVPVRLKTPTQLTGLYDNLVPLSTITLKTELTAVLEENKKPEDNSKIVPGSFLCTSPILGIRAREFNNVIKRLPDLKTEIENQNPLELMYPKTTRAAFFGACASGAVALLLAGDTIRASIKGEEPEVIKRKGLFAFLFGIFAGGLGYVSHTLAGFKFRNFTDPKDEVIYSKIDYFSGVYNRAKNACEKAFKHDDAEWTAEAENMEQLFAQDEAKK